MTRIKSLPELTRLRDDLRVKRSAKSDKSSPESIIQVKVAMATCGIASGARPVMEYMTEELEKRNIPALVTQTGCMCYCYAEPTVEVTVPGKKPVVFGFVTMKKADEIIERYIRKGELVEGIIPADYDTIDSK
ncbi:MAG: (2Fe-2S) ferredoxin domain-containing protein [Bacteroidetes bacterium]|nr:(2Fe-2S) ferredoxin domain-containing protein [Bacteroidota bacterium]